MLLALLLFPLLFFADARVTVNAFDKRSLCTTAECKEFADEIRLNMNRSVDPCTNFYEYACGNWGKRNPLPPGKQVWKMLMIAGEKNKEKIEDMMRKATRQDEIPAVRSAKAWYQACIDVESREERRMQPIISILSKIGDWPIIMPEGEWNESRYKWQVVDDYYSELRGFNFLHEVRVASYGKDSTGLSVVLDVPDLPAATWLLNLEVGEQMSLDGELGESSEEDLLTVKRKMKRDGKYWKFLSKIVSALMEARSETASAERLTTEMEDLLNFQWKLAQLTYDVGEYVNMTVGDFQRWYNNSLRPVTENGKVNWAGKIIHLLREASTDVDVDTNMKIPSLEYFKNLASLLDATPSRIIVNYIHWTFVSHAITKTTDEMRNFYEKTISMDEEEQEDDSKIDRSQECIEEAQMNDIISYEYIRQHFPEESLQLALRAIDEIENEIQLEIEGSNWATKSIKELALRKLRTLKKRIGYPSWYKNQTAVNNLVSGLLVGPNYFENSINLKRYYTLKKLRTLTYDDQPKPWIVDPLVINAFYLNEDNSITVPAANLEKPFFSPAQPNTINYGLTGFLMAHEMNHGYDAQRRIYDENGKEFDWPVDMARKYNKSMECFVERIDNYTLNGRPDGPKIKGYGEQTLEETMSDTMGLKAAFKAYKRRESTSGKLEPLLPGLEGFTNDQVFFLSFANLWCELIDPEYLPILPRFDMHGTGWMRSTSSLSNNEDFAKTFNCPIGSPMNPAKKCNTWKI